MSTASRAIPLMGLLLSPLSWPSPALGQATPKYEVYAIEYGWVPDVVLSSMLPGADSTLRVEMSAMVWLIRGPDGRNILVDTGYRPDVSNATTRSARDYLRPDQAVARLGVSAEDVSDIILTHLHWDHADGVALFPNAHVWVQQAELEYYATTAWQEGANHAGVLARTAPELVKLNTEGRVTLVQGDDQEVFPGIRAYTGPRHTYASQYLGVNTAGGTVVVASDAIWFYANLELGLANRLTFDPAADLVAFERMKKLASKPDWILPGHDLAVFKKFPDPGNGVARIR